MDDEYYYKRKPKEKLLIGHGFLQETLIYSNQRESILLTLLILLCFLLPRFAGGAIFSVSLIIR